METKVEPLGESGSLDQNKATFLSSWKTFAENTTLHGLKNTLNNNKRNSFRRLIWIFLLCFSTVSFGYSVATCWLRFTSFPIHTVITNEIGKPENGMEFPAVTICNLNNVMKSKRDTADDDRRFTELGLNVSGCQETREVRGNMTCGQAIMCALYGLTMIPGCDNTTKQKLTKALMNSSMNEEEIYSKYGHDLFDLTSHLRRCEFRETEKKCTAKDFVSSITTDGLCFTYNSGLNNFSEPYRTKVAGPRLGLNILVDLQTNETTYKDESAIGLNVIIHAQRTFVNRLQGFNVMPGTHATIGVKLIKHERLPHPYPTNCTVTNLSGIYSYTQDACSFECVSKMVIEECGCRPAGLLGPTNVPVCPIVKKTCIDQAFVKRPKWLSECNCNSACTELEYESHVSYARFPDDTTIEVLQNHGINKSSHYMKNNFVFLQVGFQKLGYEKRKYEKSYVLQGLLGEIGGNMGLMLGCSYLTICEFLEFLWDIVISRMKKKLDAAAKPVTLDNNSN